MSACSLFLSTERAALWYQQKGRKNMEKKRYGAAERCLEKSYDLAPRNPAIVQLLPQVYVQRRKFSKAADYAERFSVAQDDTVRAPETCYSLGIFLLFHGAQEKQNANALLEKAERYLKRAMRLDSLRYMPAFRLQAECNAALSVLHVLYSSYAYNPALEKPDRLHKKVLPCELILARGFVVTALRYDPDHVAAQQNFGVIERGLSALGEAPVAPDLRPFERMPVRIPTVLAEEPGADNLRLRLDANSPLRLLKLTMLDTLNKYDELILVLDISGSMEARMFPGRAETRMEVMRLIATALTDAIRPQTSIGCITVGGECATTPRLYLKTKTPRAEVRAAVAGLGTEGLTPLHQAMKSAPDLFADGRKMSGKRRGICVLSDGLNSCPDPDMICQIAQDLAVLNIQTNVISLLLEDEMRNQVEYEAYQCMSAYGGGILVAPAASGAFKDSTLPNEIVPFDVVLPEFRPDQCVSVKNLVMVSAADIRSAFSRRADIVALGQPNNTAAPAR